MSRSAISRWLGILLVMALMLPALTASARVKEEKATVKTSLSLPTAVTFAGKQLKPGDYWVVANESKVTLSKDGKVIAEAPAEWVTGKNKEHASAVVLDGDNVREIRFGGKARYVVLRAN